MASFLSPKLEARPKEEEGEFGVFALTSIQKGELLAVWGGTVVTSAQIEAIPYEDKRHSIQVEEDLFMVPVVHNDPADLVNHSCNPNAGLRDSITLVAMRDIDPGEEVCFDYAMSDGSPYDEFDCYCGSSQCRGRITGQDWLRTELWERYAGYFSPYIQARIDRLKADSPHLLAAGNNNHHKTEEKLQA